MHDVLTGFSKGLYSNWLLHRPLQLLVDAGEGAHLALARDMFAPDVVAITHGHSDHVLGLAGLAGGRRFGKGPTAKPWSVLYPRGSQGVEAVRALIGQLWRGVEFPISWIPMAPGQQHRLSSQRVIEPFEVRHVPPDPAFGYRVLERRRRLRPEYAQLPQPEVERLARETGRDRIMEEYQHVLFVHSGDAMPIEPEMAEGADLLVHDATFLAAEDRHDPIHASTEEALAVARSADVRTLVMYHLSVRYERETAIPRIGEQIAASGFTGECWLLDEDQLIRLGS
jgi:ribonuclease Z